MNRIIDPDKLRQPFGQTPGWLATAYSGAVWAVSIVAVVLLVAVLLAYDWVGNHRRQA